MTINLLINLQHGPYVHALGWTTPTYEVLTAASSGFQRLDPPLACTGADDTGADGTALHRVGGRSIEEMLADLPAPLMRASGVPRARSASKSAVFGGLVGKALIRLVCESTAVPGDRVGVAVVSSSSIVPIFWRYEAVGVSDAWDNTDTMLLPASIPSAVATAVSMITDSHAAAITLGDGVFGMCQAIEHASLAFAHDRADLFIVLGAEEATRPMHDALVMLDDRREIMDGCAGVVLSAAPILDSDWQICAMAQVPEGHEVSVAQPWASTPRVRMGVASPLTAYTSVLLPFALHAAMHAAATRPTSTALIELRVAERGAFLIALRRQSGPRVPQVFA